MYICELLIDSFYFGIFYLILRDFNVPKRFDTDMIIDIPQPHHAILVNNSARGTVMHGEEPPDDSRLTLILRTHRKQPRVNSRLMRCR